MILRLFRHRRWRRKAINVRSSCSPSVGRHLLLRKRAHRLIEVIRDVSYAPIVTTARHLSPNYAARRCRCCCTSTAARSCSAPRRRITASRWRTLRARDYLVFNIDYRLAPHFKFSGGA